jgi:hypothetical protein
MTGWSGWNNSGTRGQRPAWALEADRNRAAIARGGTRGDPALRHIIYTRKRDGNPGIKVGDSVVLFEHGVHDIQFYAHTAIQAVKLNPIISDSLIPQDQEGSAVLVELAHPEYFDPPRLLSLYNYSLLIVNNYASPEKHFNKRIRQIDHDDFLTIRDGKPFFARTLFMTCYEEFPRPLQVALQTYCMMQGVNISETYTSFHARSRLLVEFIEVHVLPAAVYLSKARKAYESIQCDQKPKFSDWVVTVDEQIVQVHPFKFASDFAKQIVDLMLGDDNLLAHLKDELAKPIEERFEGLRWTVPL